MPTENEILPPAVFPASENRGVSTVAALADTPEEDIWLAKQKSKRTRRAYKQDVQHFMREILEPSASLE
jgi:hypothetical protein